jgi:hypothetical protein
VVFQSIRTTSLSSPALVISSGKESNAQLPFSRVLFHLLSCCASLFRKKSCRKKKQQVVSFSFSFLFQHDHNRFLQQIDLNSIVPTFWFVPKKPTASLVIPNLIVSAGNDKKRWKIPFLSSSPELRDRNNLNLTTGRRGDSSPLLCYGTTLSTTQQMIGKV